MAAQQPLRTVRLIDVPNVALTLAPGKQLELGRLRKHGFDSLHEAPADTLPLVLGMNHQPSDGADAVPLNRSNRTDNAIAVACLEYLPVGELGAQFGQRLGERRDRPIVVEDCFGLICEPLQV